MERTGSAQPELHIRLLGEFRVVAGDEPVAALNASRLQALLAYLLLHRDAPQSRQRLAFLLWPDSNEDQALSNLRNILFSFRRALPFLAQYLKADRHILEWQPDTWQGDSTLGIDLIQFERALTEAERAAREGNTVAQATSLQRAIDLYKGDLLPSSYEDWILIERERLQQRFTGALENLINIYEHQGNMDGAIGAAQRLLRHNPLHEAAYKRLMGLYAANDMVPEALRIYHTCATSLERELGVEPSANTREAYERLLKSRQASPVPAPGTPWVPDPESPLRVRGPLWGASPLVGRAKEWTLLQETWRDANQGPRAVLIRGEAGIGKTRLVEETSYWVARQGPAVANAASARCYPIERRMPFGPVADWLNAIPAPSLSPAWLSEVARLRPGILAEFQNIPAPGPLTEAWQRRRFMEAISRALIANQPLLLTLDDLQWCDFDTLEYLHFLLRFDPSTRILLVMTARSEEIDTVPDAERAEALTHFLDGLRNTAHLLEIELSPLDQEETAALATTLLGGQTLDSPSASALHRETDGNPLFIVEMLRTFRMRNGELGHIPHSAFPIPHSQGLPPRIARVLNTRLGRLSPTARALVDFAAVIGRDFTLPLLQIASDESESAVVSSVDELWRHRILREQGEESYDFSHDKLRQVAYSLLTAAKRRMLHGMVAHALEEVYAWNLDHVAAQLGMHHEAAGNRSLAAQYYRQAAQAALQLYANAEAIPLYERAFVLMQHIATKVSSNGYKDGDERIVEVGESLADLLESTGNHIRARSTYQKVLGFCPVSHPLWKTRLLLKIGDTWRSQREWDKTFESYAAFDEALGDEPYDSHDEWWDLWIDSKIARLMVHYWHNAPAEMQKIAERVQPVMERCGSRLQKIKYRRAMASMYLRLGRYVASDECLRNATAALEETRELNNLVELTDSTFLMGFSLLWRWDLPQAADYLRQALSLAERTGQADYQLLSLSYLTIAYRMQGDVRRTRETVARHVAYMDSVQMPSYSETAEANLAWIAWKEGDLESAERHAMLAFPKFSESESFAWLVIWPLVAVCLAQDRLADAVRFACRQLAPTNQRAPEELIAAVKAAVEAWDGQQNDRAASHLRRALRLAHEYAYL